MSAHGCCNNGTVRSGRSGLGLESSAISKSIHANERGQEEILARSCSKLQAGAMCWEQGDEDAAWDGIGADVSIHAGGTQAFSALFKPNVEVGQKGTGGQDGQVWSPNQACTVSIRCDSVQPGLHEAKLRVCVTGKSRASNQWRGGGGTCVQHQMQGEIAGRCGMWGGSVSMWEGPRPCVKEQTSGVGQLVG